MAVNSVINETQCITDKLLLRSWLASCKVCLFAECGCLREVISMTVVKEINLDSVRMDSIGAILEI